MKRRRIIGYVNGFEETLEIEYDDVRDILLIKWGNEEIRIENVGAIGQILCGDFIKRFDKYIDEIKEVLKKINNNLDNLESIIK